jgi:hypothetical protein
MDGVLADWEGHFLKHVGRSHKDIPKEENYKISKSLNINWWASIPWLEDGKQLWKYLSNNYNSLYILSAPTNDPEEKAIKGKQLWLKKEGITSQIGLDHIILAQHKHKYVKAEGISILVDDTPEKIEKWIEAGGVGVLHTDTASTIRQLIKINKQKGKQ